MEGDGLVEGSRGKVENDPGDLGDAMELGELHGDNEPVEDQKPPKGMPVGAIQEGSPSLEATAVRNAGIKDEEPPSGNEKGTRLDEANGVIPGNPDLPMEKGPGVPDLEAPEPAGADMDSCTESLPTSERQQGSVATGPPDSVGGQEKLDACNEATGSLQLDDLSFEGSGHELASKGIGIEPLSSPDREFLVKLAEKVLESKKSTKGNAWTMKDVLATGHLSGVDVEFRKKICDAKGTGTFGVITKDNRISCKCSGCGNSTEKDAFTGTKWEEHFGGRSQRPFRHIFFKTIDISLKDFCDQWCEKLPPSQHKRSQKRRQSTVKQPASATPAGGSLAGPRCRECSNGNIDFPCEGCDALFHLKCMGMTRMPIGNWFCGDCCKNNRDTLYSEASIQSRGEKRKAFTSQNVEETAVVKRPRSTPSTEPGAGVPPVVLPDRRQHLMEVSRGCTIILRELESGSGSCALCGSPDYEEASGKDLNPRTIIICDTCECEYHIGCLKTKEMADLKELPEGDWFCSSKCRNVSHVLLEITKQGEIWPDRGLSYCVLRGRSTNSSNSKRVRRVEQIITACFDPVVDAFTGDNLLPLIVRGQRFANSWDFSGFHSLLIKVKRVWVATALFKVYKDSAEVPFVATHPDHRGKGYSLKIMQVLEKLVRKAGVQKLLLPSADATVEMWMKPKYGFSRASEDYTGGNRLLQFPGTIWLEKKLVAKRQ